MSQASVRQVAAPKPYTDFDRLSIGGTWRKGKTSRALADRDPYTGEVILEIPQADRSDLDEAYAKAATAQAAWAAELPATRATVFRRATEILEARREEVISWLIHESGSTRLKATLEWASTRAMMPWASSAPYLAERRVLPTDIPAKEGRDRKPVGVVGVISPWNWPLHLTNRSLAPSLAVGNAVVVKPASDTPMTGGLLLAKIFEEAGLPPGVLHVIVGSGSEIGDAFVDHDVPRAISFTGLTPVGRRIAELAAKAPILKRVELELGGNGPFVLLDDADVDQAVETAIFGKFLHQGQICIRINRIIVDETLYEAFLERFADRTKALKVGNPEEPDTIIGPIINEQQLKGLLQRIEDARVSGARQLAGGEAQGLVLPPHVFADVNNDIPLARNEIFGPVAPVIRARGEDDALGIANDSEHGLSGSVFTRDLERGERFARRLKIGMVHINDQPVIDLPNSPFGGEKNFGIGRFNGEWVIDAFTTDQWLTVQHAPRHPPRDARSVKGAWA